MCAPRVLSRTQIYMIHRYTPDVGNSCHIMRYRRFLYQNHVWGNHSKGKILDPVVHGQSLET